MRTTMANDPLNDDPPQHTCDSGWITVQPDYAYRLHPDLQPLEAGADANMITAWIAAQAKVEARRAGSLNTVYPCKVCKPREFYRWATGHWHPDHNPHACSDCVTPTGRRRTRSNEPAAEPLPPQRADVDA